MKVRKIPKSPKAKKNASVSKLKPINTAMATCFKYPNPLARRFKKEDLNMACRTVSFEGFRIFPIPFIGAKDIMLNP